MGCKKQGAKNRVIVIQKEKRPGCFLCPAFCNLYFGLIYQNSECRLTGQLIPDTQSFQNNIPPSVSLDLFLSSLCQPINFEFCLLSQSFVIYRSILDTVSEKFLRQILVQYLGQFWARFGENLVDNFCENFRDNFGNDFLNNFLDKFKNIMIK